MTALIICLTAAFVTGPLRARAAGLRVLLHFSQCVRNSCRVNVRSREAFARNEGTASGPAAQVSCRCRRALVDTLPLEGPTARVGIQRACLTQTQNDELM